jgi:hypothetical protein
MRLIAVLRKLAKAFAPGPLDQKPKSKKSAAFDARQEGAWENDGFSRRQLRARW